MGFKFVKKLRSRGASLPEYAIVLGVMAIAAIAIRESLWEASRDESAQQEACVSQIPPPSIAADGSGCEIPALSTTSTAPGQTTTTAPSATTAPPAQPSAPQNVSVVPTYSSTGKHFLDVSFSAPANAATVPVATYQYSTDGGIKWKSRSSGTTGSPLRIDIESNTFNAELLQATDYQVAIRAVTANGVTGKRSAIWKTGTAKGLLRCGDGTYCPSNFSTYTASGTFYGVHRFAAEPDTQIGKMYFTKTTSVTALIVAGGGGGGANGGGGGGGGGVISTTATVSGDDPYYWIITGGGGGAGTGTTRGSSGILSSFGGTVAYGGGGGSSRDGVAATPPCGGSPETQSCPTNTFSSRASWDAPGGLWSSLVTSTMGSAGGGANTTTGYRRAGGNGKTNEGRNGGWGCTNGGVDCGAEGAGGGGGGYSGDGGTGLINGTVRGGAGGSGIASAIANGSTFVWYAAGGGGGKTVNGTAGPGGACISADVGGCVGGSSQTNRRLAGMDGRGGGGGGGSGGTGSSSPGRGGGGVVFVRYTITNQLIAAAET